ncbi:MAG: SPOR domain-containing protein, partial [Pseudomonadota bacterium]
VVVSEPRFAIAEFAGGKILVVLPNRAQVTTARDMARLGLALREHYPQHYKYFSTREFRYGKTRFRNHNRLLGRIKGVDGIKTGYTRASGFNLVSSVQANGRSIVAVVLGGRTGASRNAQMEKLIKGYLPKASRRGRGQLIAKSGSTRFQPKVAGIASIPASRLPKPSANQRPSTSVASVATAYAPEPPRPSAPLDTMTTASAAPRSPWVIQIASLESQNQALDYLRTAQSKADRVLGSRDPFVEQFQKGGVIYHRARFAGFQSKGEAWGACNKLKAYKYSCLAFQQ